MKPQPPLKADGSIDETALDSEVAALMINEKYEPDVAWERICTKYGLEGSRGDVRRSEPTAEAASSRPRVQTSEEPAPTSTRRVLGVPDSAAIDQEVDQLMRDEGMSLEEAVTTVNLKYGLGPFSKRQRHR